MSRNIHFIIWSVLSIMVTGCSSPTAKFVIKNNLEIDRSFETVEIELPNSNNESVQPDATKTFAIIDSETKEEQISQLSDIDGDGKPDIILFQPELKANSEKIFELVLQDKKKVAESIPNCYSRFVPERTDDYAWENNRVAFRTYGPTAQKMIEDSIAGGTLSSGMDAWLKRVEYPIINNWYKKELETEGSYHEDDGEGLDNFHVGVSRGVGGVAVKVDSIYYYSKNFISFKTIETGPIRTIFWLEYAPWPANNTTITERKHISLDYGSNLSKHIVEVKGTDEISVGLTLHENDGVTEENVEQGWMSYWEPHGDSEIGVGVVAPKGTMTAVKKYITNKKDQSNLYAQLKVNNGSVSYYAGFGWKKSKQFSTKENWDAYLNDFAVKINTPLIVTKL